DGVVDFEDLMIFALAYGSSSGDANWNPLCDIAGPNGSTTPDGVIDFEDLMIFAMHYGKDDYEQGLQVVDEAIEEVVALTEQYGKTQAYQMIVDYLLEEEGINDAGVTPDGECVWYELDDGFTFSFSEYPDSISEYPEEKENNSLKSGPQSQTNYYPRNTSRIIPGNSKAIILDWEVGYGWLDPIPNKVRNYLDDAEYLVDYNDRSQFTLEKVMDLYQYGVVYISSHAISGDKKGIKILTGEKSTNQTNHYYRQEYGDDVINKTVGAHTYYIINIGGGFIKLGTYICFYPDFIREFAKNAYPNSLIYADVCEGYDDPTMAAAFDDVGAYVYCGYIGNTLIGCKNEERVFKCLTIDHLNIEEAISNCADSSLCGTLGYYPPDHGDLYLKEINNSGPVHNLTKDTYYNTIQAALDDADSDNIIEVLEGTYNENINFNGKNITLRSTNPNDPDVVASTVIDGGGNGSVVTFTGVETRQAVLRGLTIQNGNSEPGAGGGIVINNSSPTISGNIIRWNIANSDNGGGGIFLAHLASPLIEDNTIVDNQGGFGGGIYVGDNSSPTIRNNTIENNLAEIHNGGGIFISGSSSPTIQNNSLSDNSSQYGGGICIVENSSGEISNNYFTLNAAQYGGGIFCGEDSDPIIKENEFSGNSATSFGGGLFIGECVVVVNNNVISGNTAQTGGGIFVWESSPTISDNTINSNTTTMSGGGIYVRSNSHPTINNNIISLNMTTMDGGGLYIDGSSSVQTTNGSTWPRQNTPPNAEVTNTYFDNTHGNPLDYTEGADVYMVGAITPPQIIEPPVEFRGGVAWTLHSTRSRSITRDISNDDSLTVLYYSRNLGDTLSRGGIYHAVDVSWLAYDNCTGYRVYRSTNGMEYEMILNWDTTGIIGSAYGLYDSDIVLGNTYSYYFTAYNDTENWETVPSNIYTIEIDNETFLPPIYLDQPQDYGQVDDPNYIFKWTPVGEILPYGDFVTFSTQIQVFDSNTLDTLWWENYDDFTTSQATYNGASLINGNIYRWDVKSYGYDANGQIIVSSASENWEFTYNANNIIDGQITDVSPLTDPFDLDAWYTTNVYVKNT
ncbi:right-handed parallel beta-helix repeat-containing protein, partial [Patescibacteria group bacterium]|nr:right-handed parallel beta-helix repeat-containing protein [Patescibacteria group bacterium]